MPSAEVDSAYRAVGSEDLGVCEMLGLVGLAGAGAAARVVRSRRLAPLIGGERTGAGAPEA